MTAPVPAGANARAAATGPAAARKPPLCIPSECLFGGALEIQIEHRGVFYRLRQTALGKLILTK